MEHPTVSVVVPHYNDLAGLDGCLTHLLAQTYPPDRVEIIVADNNSPVGREAVEGVIAGRAKLVVVTDRGAGPTRNGGAAAARNDILAFTDSDCRPEPQWLDAGVSLLGRYDVVGGDVLVYPARWQHMTAVEGFDVIFGFENGDYIRRKNFTVTANLFCRRADFERVGGFLSAVSEDVEWSHRAIENGLSLGFAAEAIVNHPARRSWSELIAKWRRVDAETFALHVSYGKGRWRWFLRCLALPLSAVVHTPRLLLAKRLPVAARPAAVYGLFGIRFWRSFNSLRLLLDTRPGAD